MSQAIHPGRGIPKCWNKNVIQFSGAVGVEEESTVLSGEWVRTVDWTERVDDLSKNCWLIQVSFEYHVGADTSQSAHPTNIYWIEHRQCHTFVVVCELCSSRITWWSIDQSIPEDWRVEAQIINWWHLPGSAMLWAFWWTAVDFITLKDFLFPSILLKTSPALVKCPQTSLLQTTIVIAVYHCLSFPTVCRCDRYCVQVVHHKFMEWPVDPLIHAAILPINAPFLPVNSNRVCIDRHSLYLPTKLWKYAGLRRPGHFFCAI